MVLSRQPDTSLALPGAGYRYDVGAAVKPETEVQFLVGRTILHLLESKTM